MFRLVDDFLSTPQAMGNVQNILTSKELFPPGFWPPWVLIPEHMDPQVYDFGFLA